ncbi:glycosyltransferase family 4 protein [Gorillibacterium timonense]|uniref:glycosyltransferase family 4 protein n=1 Tax=Gorillibacterium timonense TaxID=1689269 RepID=UPI00071DAEA5|nr:glycosyltransferase family 4 protein [Gorillibacterium timonense]
MKITMLSLNRTFGGTESHVLNLMRGLQEQGHECHFLTPQADKLPGREGVLESLLPLDLGSTLRCARQIRHACEKNCDLFHVHGWDALPVASPILSDLSVPLVCTFHSVFKPETLVIREALVETGQLIQPLLAKTRKIIAISDAIKASLVKLGTAPDRIETIYNGTAAISHSARKNSIPVNSIPVIGYLGRLHVEKGPDLLLEAIARLRSRASSLKFRVEIVGEGPLEQELRLQSHSLGLDSCCTFKGFSSKPHEELSGFDVLVLPSRDEGMGLAILEAMSCGVPVIASRTGGIVEAVEPERNGLLFPSGDAEALAHSLERLLLDPALSERLAYMGRQKWEAAFRLDLFIRKHLHLYESIIHSC